MTTTAYLFPGQGSQTVGMAQGLLQHYPNAQRLFESADAVLGWSLTELCCTGDETSLMATEQQQPALFVTTVARWQASREIDRFPPTQILAGHSLGQYAACVAAGALAFEDGVRLVALRGKLMSKANAGGMIATLGLDLHEVEQLCTVVQKQTNQQIDVANDNCPAQIVVAGEEGTLELFTHLAEEQGARKIVRLPISIASHSPLMATVAAELRPYLEQTDFTPPCVPVMSNYQLSMLTTAEQLREELANHLINRVRWTETMQHLRKIGVETFIEVGPREILLQLLKRIDRSATRQKLSLGAWDE